MSRNIKSENSEEHSYEGGMVIEPIKGFYNDYVIIVDFNSLYPSIIRHFEVCFTSVKRKYIEIE